MWNTIGYGTGYSFSWLGFVFMALWWIIVIVVLAMIAKWLIGQFRGGVLGRSALDILKERYAKGEIDKKEFEEKRQEISR